jgi:hypothetical protein
MTFLVSNLQHAPQRFGDVADDQSGDYDDEQQNKKRKRKDESSEGEEQKFKGRIDSVSERKDDGDERRGSGAGGMVGS